VATAAAAADSMVAAVFTAAVSTVVDFMAVAGTVAAVGVAAVGEVADLVSD
jgi:hypothetical protein